MRAIAASRWLVLVCGLVLSACGGGGGGGGGGGSSAPSLSFSPGSVALNVQYQAVGTASIQATVQHAESITGTVWVEVEDSQGVLTGGLDIAEIDPTHFSATLHSSPSLALGHHVGTLRIFLCKDANCANAWSASPSVLPYDINVTPAPLTATAASVTAVTVHQGTASTSPLLIDVQGTGLHWSASSTAAWLQVDATKRNDSGRLTISYAATALAVGDYADAVTVHSDDGQSVVIPVTLKVIPTAFTLVNGVPSFTAVNGAPIAAQPLGFALDNGTPEPWTLASGASWMDVSALSGTTPASVTLQPHPEWVGLAAGDYDDPLTLTSPGLATSTLAAHLSLIRPTLSASDSVTFGGQIGRELRSFDIPIALDTGANTYAVTVDAPAWVNVSLPAAVGGAGGTATFSAIPSQATAGSTSATVKLTAHVNGDTVSKVVSVNLNMDQRRLLPSAWAVGFASSPTGTVTTRTLSLSANFGDAVSWTAVADAPWLSVTASGVTGGTLRLDANPALAPFGASVATVHVASTAAGVSAADVRVGLWKDATGLTTTTSLPSVALEQTMVADKILPYVYTNTGGTDVQVYNAYTATRIATIANVGSQLSAMSVSADGRRLFVLDGVSNSVQVVDLTSRTKVASWPGANLDLNPAWRILAMRPNGVDVVLLDNGVMFNEGRALPRLVDGYDPPRLTAMTVTEDQRTMADTDSTLLGYMKRLELDYTVIAGGSFIAHENGGNGTGYTALPLAYDPDGHVLYSAGQSRCWVMDGHSLQQTGSLPGGAFVTNNIVVTSDHRPVCGAAQWPNDAGLTSDVWVHSAAGLVTQSYKIAGAGHSLRGATLVATPDGLVLGVLTDDPLLAFIPIGAP